MPIVEHATLLVRERVYESVSLDTPVRFVPFAAVDLETTGSTPPDDRIIEIGAKKVHGFRLGESYGKFVNPGRRLPPFISRLTGISEKDLNNVPAAADILPGFIDYLGESVIVAHSAAFDYKFLCVEAEETIGVSLNNYVLCTCKLARRILYFLPSKGLDAITHFLGITVNGRHRAFGDAEATAKVLIVFLRYLDDMGIKTLGEVLEFQDSRS